MTLGIIELLATSRGHGAGSDWLNLVEQMQGIVEYDGDRADQKLRMMR